MYKAVIFDVDGTLLDTEKIFMQAWREAGALFGYTITQDALLRTRAVSAKIAAEIFRETAGADFPYETIKQERIRIAEGIISASKPQELVKPGVKHVLEWMKKQGFKLAVASSTDYMKTCSHLKHADLWHYFEAAVGGDMVNAGKPEPDIFQKAAGLLNTATEDCLVVGDTPADVFAGSAAGMDVILIPDQVPANERTAALSRMILEHIGQLPVFLESKKI